MWSMVATCDGVLARVGGSGGRVARPAVLYRCCFNRCFRAPARQRRRLRLKKGIFTRHASGTERGSARLVPSTERARHQRAMRRVIQDVSSTLRVIEPTTADRFVP